MKVLIVLVALVGLGLDAYGWYLGSENLVFATVYVTGVVIAMLHSVDGVGPRTATGLRGFSFAVIVVLALSLVAWTFLSHMTAGSLLGPLVIAGMMLVVMWLGVNKAYHLSDEVSL